MPTTKRRVAIIGGGFGGAYCAQSLLRRLDRSEWEVTLLDRNNYLLFYPLLIEAGVGTLEPRHVVVPIRKFLKGGDFRMSEALAVDTAAQTIEHRVFGRVEAETLPYDHLVIAVGSVTRFPEVPGLDQYAFELKSLGDAVELRDRGIGLLECANTVADREERRSILRMIVVGSNFSGIELAGEYQEFMREAARQYPKVDRDDISVVVLERGERIIPALEPELAKFAHDRLTARGLEILTKTTVTEICSHSVSLSNGKRLGTQTVVWCAGIAPNPFLKRVHELPLNEHGYIDCESNLRVRGMANVWAIGDGATVLDGEGKPYAATAQNATRQGELAAENIAASIADRPTRNFAFHPLGSLAAIGCRSAVAKVFGVKIHGFVAWFLYRTVYLMKMPSWSRRVRIVLDWTVELFFRFDAVQLGVRKLDPASRRLTPGPKPGSSDL